MLPLSLSAQQTPSNAHVGGAWGALTGWPLVAIHAALTPGGNVLTFGSDAAGQQTGKFIYDVWDPTGGALAAGHTTLPNTIGTDIFCSAQALLPQGDILIAGGDTYSNGATTHIGTSDASLFTPENNALSRAGAMQRARWYATITTLPNGESYIQGGTDGTDRPELRESDGKFRLLPIDTGDIDWYYPRNFVAPDGRIFGLDTGGKMYFVSSDFACITDAGTSSVTGPGSSAAMYAPGKILAIGGNSDAAITIDINNRSANVSPTAKLASRRDLVTATVLADGNVLATGGSALFNEPVGENNSAAIWHPSTGQWTIGPDGAVPRLYHSTALLLPDASVLVAGGGAPGPYNNINAEIYYPPYLFNSSGAFAARPSITATPATITPGVNFSVSVVTGDNISRVTLLRTGSVTHSWNMDQRFLPTTFTQSGTTLSVAPPRNSNLMPPGYYLIFVFNDAGVPSVARIVRVSIAPAVPAPQTLCFAPIGDKTFGDASFSLAASASSGLAVTFVASPSDVCTASGTSVTLTGAGTCNVTARQPGDNNVEAAPEVQHSFNVAQTAQSISFAPPEEKTFGAAPFRLSAHASSGLAVAFSSLTQATCGVTGDSVTLLGIGTCTVQARQSGDNNYHAAPAVSQSFNVAPGTITVGGGAGGRSAGGGGGGGCALGSKARPDVGLALLCLVAAWRARRRALSGRVGKAQRAHAEV